MRRADRCRVTGVQEPVMDTQRTRPFEMGNSHRRSWHRHVPNLLFSQKRQRAKSCSIALAKVVPFALQAWSETGIRFAPCRFPLRLLRTRNDSTPRSRNKSRSQQLRTELSHPSPTSVAHMGGISNLFFRIQKRRDRRGRRTFRGYNIRNGII